jgi:tRNA(Met) C34 N-acetyltransferase TmcA
MIKPLSNNGKRLLKIAQQQFYLHLPVLFENALKDVESEIIDALLLAKNKQITEWIQQQEDDLSALDWADLHSFAYGHRGKEFCLYALRKFIQLPKTQALWVALSHQQQQLLQRLVIDGESIEQVKKVLKLAGNKVVDKQLRCAVTYFLD